MSLIGAQERPGAAAGDAGVAASIKRHPLIAYFVIAFMGTWLLFVPILLSKRGFGLIDIPDAAGLILFVLATYSGPFLGAFITTCIADGKAGVRHWFARMPQWRAGLRWYMLVLIGYPLLFGVPAVLTLGPQSLQAAAHNWPSVLSGYLATLAIGFFIPTLGEEAGWRGFALPRLQGKYGPLPGTLILGALHALWHLPAYFVNGAIISGGFQPDVFLANSLAIIASTFIWTWLFNNTAGSILFATYVHAASNAMSGQLPQALNIASPDIWFAVKVMGVAALIVILLTRGRLGYSTTVATSERSNV